MTPHPPSDDLVLARLRTRWELRVVSLRRVAVGFPGEPHTGNTLWATDGMLMLVDWDTLAAAPRERDLWMVLDQAEPMEEPGTAGSGADPEALEFYRLWWQLAEIAEYSARFRRPHHGHAADQSAWEDLTQYL